VFGRPSVSTVQACICPDVSAKLPDALQSLEESSVSSASVWTAWKYGPDASQCSTSKRISFTDRYGKTAATARTSGLHCPDTILDKPRRGDVRATPPEGQVLLWKLGVVEVQPSGR